MLGSSTPILFLYWSIFVPLCLLAQSKNHTFILNIFMLCIITLPHNWNIGSNPEKNVFQKGCEHILDPIIYFDWAAAALIFQGFFVLLKNIVSHRQPYPSSQQMKVSDGIKQTPRVHDWNVSNNTLKRRPALHVDRQATGGELKWGQTTESRAEGGRQGWRGEGEGGSESDNLVSRSLLSTQWFNLVAPSHLS